jgi:hypothetical protein
VFCGRLEVRRKKKTRIGIFNPSDLLRLTLSPAVIGVAVTVESQDVPD